MRLLLPRHVKQNKIGLKSVVRRHLELLNVLDTGGYKLLQHVACHDASKRDILVWEYPINSIPHLVDVQHNPSLRWLLLHLTLGDLLKRANRKLPINPTPNQLEPSKEEFWKINQDNESGLPVYKHPSNYFWSYHLTTSHLYMVFVSATIVKLAIASNLSCPYIISRIVSPAHVAICLLDRHNKTIEIFDASGISVLNTLVNLILQTLLLGKEYNQVTIVSEDILQSIKEDVYCNTWIWYWTFCPLIRNQSQAIFSMKNMKKYHPECRIMILKHFRTLLQTVYNNEKIDFTLEL